MSYTDEDVKRLLGYLFNGGKWRRPETPDEEMPSAKASPAHLGTDMAEAVDMRRAWFATLERGGLLDPMALFKAYGQGLPVSTVAGERGVPSSTCEWRIYRDVAVLTGAINRGDRPNPNLRSIT